MMNKNITLAIQELKGNLITKFGHDVELKLFVTADWWNKTLRLGR